MIIYKVIIIKIGYYIKYKNTKKNKWIKYQEYEKLWTVIPFPG